MKTLTLYLATEQGSKHDLKTAVSILGDMLKSFNPDEIEGLRLLEAVHISEPVTVAITFKDPNDVGRWIPVTERYPTEEDADKDGFVMIRWRRKNKPSDIGMERAIWDSLNDDADGEMTEIHFLPLNNALPEHPDEST